MNRKLVYWAMAIAAAGGCSKEAEQSSEADRLAGTWQWLRTDGGIAFHIHETPSSTGHNIDLKMAADGTYALYTNGAQTSGGTYALEKRTCIHDHTEKTYINFSADVDVMVERVNKETLDVSDEAYDGVGSSYKRKQQASE